MLEALAAVRPTEPARRMGRLPARALAPRPRLVIVDESSSVQARVPAPLRGPRAETGLAVPSATTWRWRTR